MSVTCIDLFAGVDFTRMQKWYHCCYIMYLTLQLLPQLLKKHPPLLLLLNQSNQALKLPQQLQPSQMSNNLNQKHSRSNRSQYLMKLFIYPFNLYITIIFLRFKCSSCITFTHQIWRYYMSLSSLKFHLFFTGHIPGLLFYLGGIAHV